MCYCAASVTIADMTDETEYTISEPISVMLRDGTLVQGTLWMRQSRGFEIEERDFELEYEGRRYSGYCNGTVVKLRAIAKPVLAKLAEEMAGKILKYEEAVASFKQHNYKAAFQLAEPLAEQGDAKCQCLLGDLYKGGLGVNQDFAEAVRWYHKAADQGLHWAQNRLAVMYEKGRGVPQDYVQAYIWLNLSASEYTDAEKQVRNGVIADRERVASNMSSEQIADAQKLTRDLQLAMRARKAR
jgi:uncharacterized protein